MKRVFRWAFFTAALLTAGCELPEAPPASPPAAGPAAAPMAVSPIGQNTNASIVTQIAGPATYLGQMPTAIVLLKAGNAARDNAFCQEFVKVPTAAAALSATVIAPNIIATRWPVTVTNMSETQASDCSFLVANYDYTRAGAIMADITLTNGNFNGVGPFLLVIDGSKVVAVDGSSYTNFATFVGNWHSALDQIQNQADATGTSNGGLAKSIWTILKAIITSIFPRAGGALGIIEGVIKDAVC